MKDLYTGFDYWTPQLPHTFKKKRSGWKFKWVEACVRCGTTPEEAAIEVLASHKKAHCVGRPNKGGGPRA